MPSSTGHLHCNWTDPVSSVFLSCHWKECSIPWDMVRILPASFKMIKWRGGRGSKQRHFWGNRRTKLTHSSAQGENIAHFWCQCDGFEGGDSLSISYLSCGSDTSVDMNCLMNSMASSPGHIFAVTDSCLVVQLHSCQIGCLFPAEPPPCIQAIYMVPTHLPPTLSWSLQLSQHLLPFVTRMLATAFLLGLEGAYVERLGRVDAHHLQHLAFSRCHFPDWMNLAGKKIPVPG